MSLESRLNISGKEAAAIEKAKKIADDIVKRFPFVAEDYRSISTRKDIIDKYELLEVYGKNISVVKTALHYALHELIPCADEMEDIAVRIREKSGKDCYEKRKGIGAFNRKKQKRSGKKSALKRGNLPWSEEEKKTLLDLADDPAYQHISGSRAGRPDHEKIQVRLYQMYGTRRTINTLYHRLSELRRKKC